MSASPRAEEISGVIIAGGKASRMGGINKAFLPLAGKPMIQYVIDALRPQVAELLINANHDLDTYRGLGLPVIPDLSTDYQGPLAGILAALTAASREWVQIAPCDGPLLPTDLALRLHQQAERTEALLCIPHDGNRLQPLFGLFHRSLASAIQQFLDRGDRKLLLWLESQSVAVADFSDQPESFININTPQEQKQAEQQLLTTRQ
jgi:molybdopterin-guanine dinucleotide biosynthesis protein A